MKHKISRCGGTHGIDGCHQLRHLIDTSTIRYTTMVDNHDGTMTCQEQLYPVDNIVVNTYECSMPEVDDSKKIPIEDFWPRDQVERLLKGHRMPFVRADGVDYVTLSQCNEGDTFEYEDPRKIDIFCSTDTNKHG